MKGDPKLIEALNGLLADELSAINQYMVHAEMCEDWGYAPLHDAFKQRAINEMQHAERLIGRILFLEGEPVVHSLNEIRIGHEIPDQLENDRDAEAGAIAAYNAAIRLASDLNDNATRDMLGEILLDEDRHLDELEEMLGQIEHMTLPTFLTTKVR